VLRPIEARRAYRHVMRQLRFVSVDEDHAIVQTADGAEQFSLLIDTALRDAVRTDLPRHAAGPASEPARIGPREIQMRVRAGESPDELAVDSGTSLERILRFAGPVLEERNRIAGEARRARARRSTTEGQTVVFGEAVDERFGAYGIGADTVSWDARRREDGQWVIIANWIGGEAERQAEWAFDRSTRSVTPSDETAADLLSDKPIRALVTAEPGRANLMAAPPLVPGIVAFPARPDAHTGPLPQVDEVFDQEAASPDAPRRTGATKPFAPAAAPMPSPAPPAGPAASVPSASIPPAPVPSASVPPVSVPSAAVEPPADELEAPPLPLRLADPVDAPEGAARDGMTAPLPRLTNLGVAGRIEETEEQRAERARIPSWDDILLGVRRKRD
jgi:DUF3071 family protein